MKVQARSVSSEILGELSVTGRQTEYLVCLFHRRLDIVARLIRPYISRAVVRLLQDIAQSAPLFVGHADIAVALVVLEQYIVLRGMLLNQRALEYQTLKLTVGDDVLEVIYVFDHAAYLFGMVVLRTEVLADAVLELFRLADVDYLAVFVFHYIYSGLQRQSHRLSPEFFKFRIHSFISHALACPSYARS